jgi:CO/xanthine dehydrogenase FAD-binding subunit
MADQREQVFFPTTFQELFSAWTRFPDAVLFAGGTGFIRNQGRQILNLPGNILSLDKLHDLHRVTRTERYLELGAMVKLNDIIRLGKIVPDALTRTLESIACPQLRSLATIGGNICTAGMKLDTSTPMIALDAVYELRTAQSSRWISASRFSSLPGPLAFKPQEILARIRIPLDQWDYTVFRKFGSPDAIDSGGIVVFIMKNQKNVLTDFHLVFAGKSIFRDKNSESTLIGKQLPLNHRDALDFTERWISYLSSFKDLDDFLRAEFINFIESLAFNLAD